ncbi:hypothetical protein AVEN_42098-1 [Araneus ventricosus]|uniref:Uncharacterized protein n=1 Tax=Araneus ventricosus TaxID=182803 RepID=A0A4Y2SWI1_ARAVE|nr:hypothetical protein AVEN_42098-1 [Araneus ventricosus]
MFYSQISVSASTSSFQNCKREKPAKHRTINKWTCSSLTRSLCSPHNEISQLMALYQKSCCIHLIKIGDGPCGARSSVNIQLPRSVSWNLTCKQAGELTRNL